MQPTKDERLLAALGHASILINIVNMLGMIATLLLWVTQRERSAYVRRHALQALLYQGITMLVSMILILGWGLCLGLALMPMALRPELYGDYSLPASFWLALAGLIVPIVFGSIAIVYGLFGAFQTFRGVPFRYPLVGRLVDREFAFAPAVASESTATPTPAQEAAGSAPVAPSAPASTPVETGTDAASAPAPTQPTGPDTAPPDDKEVA